MTHKYLLFAVLTWISASAYAQYDSTENTKSTLSFEAFGDFYWGYDFNQPVSGKRQDFMYNHNQHASVNLNLGYAKIAYTSQKIRANLAVQNGTYVQENYAGDHPFFRYFHEANMGISLNKKKNIWLDAGIFPSHIGYESAISSNNTTLSRSIVAENSPYYLAGAKLSFKPHKKWDANISILNGWQQIQWIQGNSLPAFGTQLSYTANQKIFINWSTFLGSIYPDSTRRMRHYHNLFAQWNVLNKLTLIGGFDIGFEQEAKNSSRYLSWASPLFIAQYKWNSKWKTALRIEQFKDLHNIVINPINNQLFNVSSYSVNADFAANQNILLRFETRYFDSKYPIFNANGNWQNDNFFFLGSLVFKLQKTKIF